MSHISEPTLQISNIHEVSSDFFQQEVLLSCKLPQCAFYNTLCHYILNQLPMMFNTHLPWWTKIPVAKVSILTHSAMMTIMYSRPWSRTLQEQRLCQCGLDVQTEGHVLLHCDLSDQRYNVQTFNTVSELLDGAKKDLPNLAKYCTAILNFYTNI